MLAYCAARLKERTKGLWIPDHKCQGAIAKSQTQKQTQTHAPGRTGPSNQSISLNPILEHILRKTRMYIEGMLLEEQNLSFVFPRNVKMAPASDANERASTSASKEDEKCSDHHQSKIILTGFGPFGGVDKNPSTTLVNTFQEYLQNSPDQWKQHLATRIEQCLVLETSANSVRQALDELAIQKFNATAPPPPTTTTPTKTTKTTIMLHLGVNYRGTGFQLEQCAYNDATFRIPDQQGYQPQNIAVVPDSKVGTRFDTTLNVQSLVDKMSLKYPQIETKLSTDPGRFLCNYLYCYSLKKLQSSPLSQQEQQEEQELPYQNHNVECLFLHIPHFTVVSEESQLDYCAELMRQLLEICN